MLYGLGVPRMHPSGSAIDFSASCPCGAQQAHGTIAVEDLSPRFDALAAIFDSAFPLSRCDACAAPVTVDELSYAFEEPGLDALRYDGSVHRYGDTEVLDDHALHTLTGRCMDTAALHRRSILEIAGELIAWSPSPGLACMAMELESDEELPSVLTSLLSDGGERAAQIMTALGSPQGPVVIMGWFRVTPGPELWLGPDGLRILDDDLVVTTVANMGYGLRVLKELAAARDLQVDEGDTTTWAWVRSGERSIAVDPE